MSACCARCEANNKTNFGAVEQLSTAKNRTELNCKKVALQLGLALTKHQDDTSDSLRRRLSAKQVTT